MTLEDELNEERAIEREYGRALERKTPTRAVAGASRGQRCTAAPPDLGYGDLLGRVALRESHDLINDRSDFYISSRYVSLPELSVFSWSAPIACTFFRGASHHELCDDVVAIRTYERTGARISGFTDDFVEDVARAPFSRRTFSAPRAPRAVRLPTRPGDQPAAPLVPERHSPEHAPAPVVREPATPLNPVRAAEALLRRLHAPRAASLAPVLATLQPDQYQVTTAPGSVPLVVDGKPGTGKTVVAIHRAAYLLSPEGGLAARERVLLVGPSPQYVRHVRAIRDQLVGDDDRLLVTSVPEILSEVIKSRQGRVRGKIANGWRDVDPQLALIASDAVAELRRPGPLPAAANDAIKQAFDLMRSNGSSGRLLSRDPEWQTFLSSLPEYRAALELRSLQPLLAWICWKLDPPPHLRSFTHIVVDEAQDVLPLEWALLDAMNTGGAWTLLGDMNQRRSDYALHTWTQIADELGILDEAGRPPIHHLERGYRSTQAIIQFANRLLPRAERAMHSMQQGGDEPAITRVGSRSVASTAASRAEDLAGRFAEGTTAVISVAPDEIRQVLRSRGWLTTSSLQRLTRDRAELTVVHPDDARGLEFDAVVVVEPSAFTPNLGRHGQLYTALSRANRSLSIVHSAPLPDDLRGRAR